VNPHRTERKRRKFFGRCDTCKRFATSFDGSGNRSCQYHHQRFTVKDRWRLQFLRLLVNVQAISQHSH